MEGNTASQKRDSNTIIWAQGLHNLNRILGNMLHYTAPLRIVLLVVPIRSSLCTWQPLVGQTATDDLLFIDTVDDIDPALP